MYGGALLSDDTGMGKTYTALAVAQRFPSLVIVAPAALRAMWINALIETACDARFVSYEQLSRGQQRQGGALAIVDEAHHARNPRTRRYAALARLTMGGATLLLTATPVHNRLAEVRAQLALFLGARAYTLGSEDLLAVIVRRRHDVLRDVVRLPRIAPPVTLRVAHATDVLRELQRLPPALPAADDGAADALLRLGLLRAWTSSDAALRATLRRRLHRAEALRHALESGRFPTRRELLAWSTIDDTVQLAFPELMASSTPAEIVGLRRTLDAHASGVRRILDAVDAGPANDSARSALLAQIAADHRGEQLVAFTQFTDTARAMYRALRPRGGVALVTSHGAIITSGRVSREEIVRRFGTARRQRDCPRFPLDVLIATDVLSEGLNLQGASVLVHLDLPWTVARLEQRLGRLRRMESAHARISVYSIGPPAKARILAGIVRVLQRKARLMVTMGSDVDVWSQAPLLSSRDPPGVPGGDLTSLAEELRAVLRTWLPSGMPTREHETAERGMAAAFTTDLDVPWSALMLAQIDGQPTLVAVAPTGATTHPAAVLRVARLASQPGLEDPFTFGDPGELASGPAGDAYRTATRWCAERQGGALTAAALDAPSSAHLRVLRRLAASVASCTRRERAAIAAGVAEVRRAVLAARGAGAEHALSEWLSAEAAMVDRGARAKIAALRELLPDSTHHRLSGNRSETLLVALLVLLRRGR
jgi:superfamily II DNA or RNA helicase